MQAQLVALIVATSFAAGLNLPATIATLGVLERAGVVTLPASLQLLGNWWVIGASIVLLAIEFIVDKIPAVDLVWNALQTFVRVPAGALLGYAATTQLSPELQFAASFAGATVAFLAHGGKTAARAAVTASPEPFSNIALSFAEDVMAVGLSWLAARHPYWAATIALIALAVIVLFVRLVIRALRSLFQGSRGSRLETPSQKALHHSGKGGHRE